MRSDESEGKGKEMFSESNNRCHEVEMKVNLHRKANVTKTNTTRYVSFCWTQTNLCQNGT